MEEKKLENGSFKECNSIDELKPEEQELIKSAELACTKSYSPYSQFEVGAAILLKNGKIIQGANQENAAYPSGLCAERTALFYIGANFGNEPILQIAVTARRKGNTKFIPATPCGSCRQVMIEFEMKQHRPIEVIMKIDTNKWIKTKNVRQLLPFSFNRNSL